MAVYTGGALYGRALTQVVASVTVAPRYSGTPGGEVLVTSGQAQLCTVRLARKKGKCSPSSATALGTGKRTITATYQASTSFLGSSASKTLTVNA